MGNCGQTLMLEWFWCIIFGDEIKSFPSLLQLKDKERQIIKERFKVRRS